MAIKKILAVDDDITNLELFEAILTRYLPDHQVLLAYSGPEAIKIAREELPQTILLDVIMPGMNGFEVCRELKMNKLTKHIPVIMISALGQNIKDRISGLDSGADAFISKPFNKNELILQVKVMLRISNAEESLKIRNRGLKDFIEKQTREFHDFTDRFQQISEYALVFFWEIDHEGLITYVSPGIKSVLGHDSNEYLNKKCLHDFCNPEEKDKMKASLVDIITNQKSISNEQYLCSHKSGKKIWLSISGFPIFNNDMTLIGYRGTGQDITIRVMDDTAMKERLVEVKAYQKKLQYLNSEIILAEERERRKIAEFLHDGIGQALSITNIKLTSLLAGEHNFKTQKVISESSVLVRDAIVKSRLLTYDLSPPILYERGVIPAIKWKLDQLEAKHQIDTFLDCEVSHTGINEDMKVLLYRTICELFTNIIKHAEAKLIKVTIRQKKEYLCITVYDNGKGFDYQSQNQVSKHGGFGLFSIRERFELIEGSIDIESEKGKGTKVLITIPANKD